MSVVAATRILHMRAERRKEEAAKEARVAAALD